MQGALYHREPAGGGPFHSESVRGGPFHSESGKDGSFHSESVRGGPFHSESGKDGSFHSESGRGGPFHSKSVRGGPSHSNPVRGGSFHFEPVRGGSASSQHHCQSSRAPGRGRRRGHCSRLRMALLAISLVGLVAAIFAFVVLVVVPCASSTSKDQESDGPGSVRVGAFNIQQFGKQFMKDKASVKSLLEIFRRYDVVLVQEARDSRHAALRDLNARLSSTGHAWSYVSSAPLGRSSSYREQYVFFYKVLSARFMGSWQTDDSAHDVYEREPFAAEFQFSSAAGKSRRRVVFLALHAKPSSALEELQQLPATIREVAAAAPLAAGVVAMGDFNADCSYLSAKKRRSLELFTSPDFISLIPDDADTTVAPSTHCAYDRLVAFGPRLDLSNGSVFDFQAALGLNYSQACRLSDHFPVEFLLY